MSIRYDSKKIILRKNSSEFEFIDWDSNSHSYNIRRTTKCLIEYLNEIIELESGVTFGEFMRFIFDEKYIDEYSHIFSSYLGHYNLRDWKKEFESSPIKSDSSGMTELHVSFDEVDIGVTNFVNNIPSFHGWGKLPDGTFTGFGIEYTPLSDLNDYPLIFKSGFDITDFSKDGDDKLIVHLERSITVFDIIAAILYEISWSGSPSDRDIRLHELKESLNQAQEDLKNNKTERFVTSDEFFESLEKRIDKFKNDKK